MIPNFFKMNDWEMKKFICVVLAIQFSLIGLLGMEAIGFKFPVLRQLIGFVYLTFIPGFLILRILRIHSLDSIQSVLFAVGLSLSFLMFLGLLINALYPHFGISKPISPEPLVISISIFILGLCFLSYFRDKNFLEKNYIKYEDFLNPSVLFLSLIPFLVIFGTYLKNHFELNILLMILIPLIGSLPIFAVVGVFKEKQYPLLIFVVSISLLYHRSLISNWISGWDIQLEFYFSNRVITDGYWDFNLYGSINGMPAIVMLAPFYSIFCDLHLVWVFKIIYPFIFSFLPLAMYSIFQKLQDEKMALIACSFFMFVGFFYSTMLQLARQQIAEVYLALLILLIVSEFDEIKKRLLLLIFGVSLIFSHYGTAYLFMVILFANLFTFEFLKHHFFSENNSKKLMNFGFTMFFTLVTFSWYMIVAGSNPFNTFVNSASIIITEFLNPFASDAFHFAIRQTAGPFHEITRILHYITQILTIFGILELISVRRIKIVEFSSLSIVFLGLWFLAVITPYYGFDFTRVYHITLIVLSLYFSRGAIAFANFVKRFLNINRASFTKISKFLSVFLLVFLLFNAGWVYEITKDHPSSIAISEVDYPSFNYGEVLSAKWLHLFKEDEGKIYADDHRWLLIIGFEGYLYTSGCPYPLEQILSSPNSYIFLGTYNIKTRSALEKREVGPRIFENKYLNLTILVSNLNTINKIYTNGYANIFKG